MDNNLFGLQDTPFDGWVPVFKRRIPANSNLFHKPLKRVSLAKNKKPKMLVGELCRINKRIKSKTHQNLIRKDVPDVPLMLFDKKFSLDKILFHFDGKPTTAENILQFVSMFELHLATSHATIISPHFIPKSKLAAEANLVRLITQQTRETSFIKFNFSDIGDFWNYAHTQGFTFMVTSRKYVLELTQLLQRFYEERYATSNVAFYLT